MTNRTTETKHEQTMRNLFDRISCIQATSDFHCGEGLEWKNGHPSIRIHGFVSTVGLQKLATEGRGTWYDEQYGLRVY